MCVALSGGADSVSLLCALYELRDQLGVTLSAVHINHCLRGDESEGDEQFVRSLCAQLGVPLSVHRFAVADIAAERKQSIELCAREVRYGVFDSLIADGIKVATAHTADDNLETVLINLTRGTGLHGIGGIPPVRGGIIRPICLCTRDDVEQYLADTGRSFVTDSTNSDTDITRNRMRHLVVPQLRQINPVVSRSVLRLSQQCRSLADMVDRMAARLLSEADCGGKWRLSVLTDAERPVLTVALKIAAEQTLGADADAGHIDRLCQLVQRGRGRLQMSGGFALADGDCLQFAEKARFARNEHTAELQMGDNFIGGYKVSVCAQNTQIVHKKNAQSAICCAKINGKLVLRTRRPGDIIHLVGRPGKSLKKLFNEHAVPLIERDRLPVIADDSGVVWVHRFGCDRRVKSDGCAKCIAITVEEENNDK